MFHLAGIPSYLPVAELAGNKVMRGILPRPAFPEKLRTTTPPLWRGRAAPTLRYARGAYVPRGRTTEVVGALATAGMQTAHAILAARGEWITNEKQLLHRARLRGLDTIVAEAGTQPATLERAVSRPSSRSEQPIRPVRSTDPASNDPRRPLGSSIDYRGHRFCHRPRMADRATAPGRAARPRTARPVIPLRPDGRHHARATAGNGCGPLSGESGSRSPAYSISSASSASSHRCPAPIHSQVCLSRSRSRPPWYRWRRIRTNGSYRRQPCPDRRRGRSRSWR